jgi:hypothetical protein
MGKKNSKKLSLSRETVLQLDTSALDRVRGGATGDCNPSVTRCGSDCCSFMCTAPAFGCPSATIDR